MTRDYPCVLDAARCPNKQEPHTTYGYAVCHGSYDERCYVNWASTDPEDVEPYADYLRELEERG